MDKFIFLIVMVESQVYICYNLPNFILYKCASFVYELYTAGFSRNIQVNYYLGLPRSGDGADIVKMEDSTTKGKQILN